MAGKVATKQKEKPPGEKKKASPAANGAAGLLANAYNPLSGTFHNMEGGAPEPQENGSFGMGDASDSDSDDERDEANGGEDRRGGAQSAKDKESKAEKRDREKMRLRNEKKHQRQKERRAQELKEKCLSLLTAQKVEALAVQLEAMGFVKDQAIKAVCMHGGNLERGVSWLLEAGPEVASTSVDPGQAKVDIADELARLVDAELKYGITRGEVERVVVSQGGDLDRAMEALAVQYPVQRPPQQAAPPNGLPKEQKTANPAPPSPMPSHQRPPQGAPQPQPAAVANGPGSAGWNTNSVTSSSASWGTPPSANSTRQTWQGGQQPQSFAPPFPPAVSAAAKQRAPGPPGASSPSPGASFVRQPDPSLGRQAYSPEAQAPQRPPYQPYPYRPQIALQQGGNSGLQGSPPQLSRAPASRPGGLPQRQFLPPQNAPQLSPQQQQLLWQQQQHKGALPLQGGAFQSHANGLTPFVRPNVRGFGPSAEVSKPSSSLSAAAAPWPGSQIGMNGATFSQMNARGPLPQANTSSRQGSPSVAPIGPPQSPSSSSSPHSRGSSSPQAAGGAFGSPIWPPSTSSPAPSMLSPTSNTWGGLGPGLGATTALPLTGSSVDWSLRSSSDRPKSGGGSMDWSLPGVSAGAGVDWSLNTGSSSASFGSSVNLKPGFSGPSPLSSIWSNDRPASGGSPGPLAGGLGGLGALGAGSSAGRWRVSELAGKDAASDPWASSKESSGWETPFGGKDLFRGEGKSTAGLGLGNSEQEASAAALLNNLSLQ